MLRIFLLLISITCAATTFSQAPAILPHFKTFIRYDNRQAFPADSLSGHGQYVLIFYDPGCGHCQELGDSFSENWAKWREDVNFYFISMAEPDLVDSYINKYVPNLKDRSNVSFLWDQRGEFIELFDPQNFPSTYIYRSDNHRLVEMYDGANETKRMERHLSN